MIRSILEQLGILSPVVLTKTNFLVTVFVMSEGTAQGIPRPLQVFTEPLSFSLNMGARYETSAETRMIEVIGNVIRCGYTHTLADGTRVTHAPHTIYKVTSKKVTED